MNDLDDTTIPFPKAKRKLIDIINSSPETKGTVGSGIVAYNCIMNEKTHEINGKGGFAGDVRSCVVAVVALIEQLARGTGMEATELANHISSLVSDEEVEQEEEVDGLE